MKKKKGLDIRFVAYYTRNGRYIGKEDQIFSRIHRVGDTFIRRYVPICILDRHIIDQTVHYKVNIG